jgi:hypothetical protein
VTQSHPYWDRLILDAAPPVRDLASLACGDLDGDSHVEVVVGGNAALLWYRPDTFAKGTICEGGGRFPVGLALEDLDGDGIVEVVTSRAIASAYRPRGVRTGVVEVRPAGGA